MRDVALVTDSSLSCVQAVVQHTSGMAHVGQSQCGNQTD